MLVIPQVAVAEDSEGEVVAQDVMEIKREGGEFQVFIGGKKYGSFEEYKSERLKEISREAYVDKNKNDFDTFLAQVRYELSKLQIDDSKVEDIHKIFEELCVNNLELKHEEVKPPTVEEMQSMLDDYSTKTKKQVSHPIDPKKVKTIVINPSE